MTRSYGGVPIDEFVVVHASVFESVDVAASVAIGVGKVAAATGLYALLVALEGRRPVRGVLLAGVAGACPDRVRGAPGPVRIGDVCIVGTDQLADEGVQLADGFRDFGQVLGERPRVPHREAASADAFLQGQRLVDTGPFPANPRMASDAAARLQVPIVRGATVSTCSGVDALAHALHRRTHADVETMEGAAVAAVCRRRELPLLHVRAISNWTGDRDRGEWNLGAAVDALRRAIARLFQP